MRRQDTVGQSQPAGQRRNRPVVIGAVLGAVVGTLLVMAITLLGGAADWYLLGIGGTVDGALLGAVIGAAVREHQPGHDRSRTHRPVRVISLWAAIGLCIALGLSTMLEQSMLVCALLGLAVGTVTGGALARVRASPAEPDHRQ